MSRVCSTNAVSIVGVRALPIRVEAHVSSGLPAFTLVGLPDASLREAKERVRAAISSCGFQVAASRFTVNLSPAELPKSGSGFDLAIAIAMLWVQEAWPIAPLAECVFLSELALDGTLQHVRGVLPAVIAAQEQGFKKVIVAPESLPEASLVKGIEALAFPRLSFVVDYLRGKMKAGELSKAVLDNSDQPHAQIKPSVDFSEVRGQKFAKYALEVAAAGGHHLLMVGVPGAGKTMLARCFPSILPDLPTADSLSASSVASISGHLDPRSGLITRPPFIAPHHGTTMAAMIGGGSGTPRPGLISQAHSGVLFLDEAAEFAPSVLDALRQPLEEGKLVLNRVRGGIELPARFQLILATNPCPCGNALSRKRSCECSPIMKRRYAQRLSGPLRDRIDINLLIEAPTRRELESPNEVESSTEISYRIKAAREFSRERLQRLGIANNARMRLNQQLFHELYDVEATSLLQSEILAGRISMRAHQKIARLARTVADLEASPKVSCEHVQIAMALRGESE